MRFIPETTYLDDYLKATHLIDFHHSAVQNILATFDFENLDDIEKTKRLYEFVRDKIAHSWDIQSQVITQKASEVATVQTGICYAKSNLLAALLRSCGIPCGFCYQRLMLFDTPDKGYCIHAFNAAYLHSLNRWVVMDARGNKSGIHAEFSLTEAKLAFHVNEALNEITYPTIFYEPNPKTMHSLEQASDCLEMYKYQLPDQL